MASQRNRQFGKAINDYDDNEGLDYDDYSYDGFTDYEDFENWAKVDEPGRVKSKKQAHKFARRHGY